MDGGLTGEMAGAGRSGNPGWPCLVLVADKYCSGGQDSGSSEFTDQPASIDLSVNKFYAGNPPQSWHLFSGLSLHLYILPAYFARKKRKNHDK
jgi:hypothetical protein